MWDPKYKGSMTMENEMRETIGAALKLLGYSLNSKSEDELTQAGDKLIEQKPLVLAYDSNNMKRNMIQGTRLVHARNATPCSSWTTSASSQRLQRDRRREDGGATRRSLRQSLWSRRPLPSRAGYAHVGEDREPEAGELPGASTRRRP
jgi:hypothetical protein